MAKKKVKKVKKVVEPVIVKQKVAEPIEFATFNVLKETAMILQEKITKQEVRIDKLVSVLKDVKGIKPTVFDGI